MRFAIIGFGSVGQALARAFARKNIEVSVAGRRPPEAIAPQAKAIGPTVTPTSLQDALKAEIIILAVPFGAHKDLAKAANWHGKVVIDVTNAYGVPPEELGGLPSSAVNAQALTGVRLVKGLQPLGRTDPRPSPGRQGRAASHIRVKRRRRRGHPGGGVGRATRLRAGQAGEARRGRFARPGARKNLGPADFPGLRQVRKEIATPVDLPRSADALLE